MTKAHPHGHVLMPMVINGGKANAQVAGIGPGCDGSLQTTHQTIIKYALIALEFVALIAGFLDMTRTIAQRNTAIADHTRIGDVE